MDPDILRLILLVLGILVLLGIYFWGRTHEKSRRRAAAGGGRLTRDSEPVFRALSAEDMKELRTENEASVPPRLDPDLENFGEIVAEECATGGADDGSHPSAGLADPALEVQEDLFPASKHDARPATSDAGGTALPVKILQINVVASRGRFDGQEILKTSREIGLQAGEMQIFHRFAPGSKRVLFSMASLVEPGSFPLDTMAGFSTPGLTLFAQLPGPSSGPKVYSDMLEAAGRLAHSLGGQLQDETHSALTKQTIEHTRAEILEYSRKLALARKRP